MRGLTKQKGKDCRGISIRWRLVFYLLIFLSILLLITWLFQVLLLDAVFEHIKRKELGRSANALVEELDSDRLQTVALNHAVDYSMNILIYRFSEGIVQEVVKMDFAGKNNAAFPPAAVDACYRKALQNDGEYTGKFAFGGYEIQESPWDFFSFLREQGNERIPDRNVRLVHARLAQDADGAEYILVLSADLIPLDSMVSTWKMQFSWIALLMLVAMAVMVWLLYRKISKPLIRMTESAKRLALGKYDVEFSGEGYRETRELAETLNYASRELSRVDHLQKELIANISHDLRTPLTMIKGYGEVMRDLPGENTPENVQVIIDETARLSQLVDDLLDLSKLQSGARSAEYSLFDLTSAVGEILGRYDTLTRHRGYEITFHSQDSVYVYADRGMILQVLYNLINNAINYTGADLKVKVTQEILGETVRISVEDTGEGIPTEQIPLIWDRYYKVDKVHRRATIGTGLGLSIVKGILELHSAAYGVDSTVGKGSIFWFELPVFRRGNDNDG
ncbi:MAG: HAMP domain-containing histidine kinase [Clostridia bacterium]|nr:HAMP domain-containing histidine kinase [Clostridia bacterium]